MSLSTYSVLAGVWPDSTLCDTVVSRRSVYFVVRTRPRAILHASQGNNKKINSWVPFTFSYGHGVPLGSLWAARVLLKSVPQQVVNFMLKKKSNSVKQPQTNIIRKRSYPYSRYRSGTSFQLKLIRRVLLNKN